MPGMAPLMMLQVSLPASEGTHGVALDPNEVAHTPISSMRSATRGS